MPKILAAVQAALALITIGAVTTFAPPCQKLLTLDNGNQIPMKCHWAGQAAILVAALIIVLAVVAILAGKEHKKVQIGIIAAGIGLILVFGPLIGVCMNSEMMCHTTALWGRVLGGAIIVCGIIDLFAGREGQIPS